MSTLNQKEAHRFLQQAGGDIEQAAKLGGVSVTEIKRWVSPPTQDEPKRAVTHSAFLNDYQC